MSMTGMMKTYTKNDIKITRKESNKQNIDSYNPSTSSRELNPYWKGGGSGLPESHESARKSKQFIRPTDDDDDFYNKSYSSKEKYLKKPNEDKRKGEHSVRKSYNWRKEDIKDNTEEIVGNQCNKNYKISQSSVTSVNKTNDSLYLSDEKMNKLAARIVKAEILGDTKLVNELKQKLEAAREFRRQNPATCSKDNEDGIMLMTTTSSGNSRPLSKVNSEDPRSNSGKRKAETHNSNQRIKYFANDDKYSLSQMVSKMVTLTSTSIRFPNIYFYSYSKHFYSTKTG